MQENNVNGTNISFEGQLIKNDCRKCEYTTYFPGPFNGQGDCNQVHKTYTFLNDYPLKKCVNKSCMKKLIVYYQCKTCRNFSIESVYENVRKNAGSNRFYGCCNQLSCNSLDQFKGYESLEEPKKKEVFDGFIWNGVKVAELRCSSCKKEYADPDMIAANAKHCPECGNLLRGIPIVSHDTRHELESILKDKRLSLKVAASKKPDAIENDYSLKVRKNDAFRDIYAGLKAVSFIALVMFFSLLVTLFIGFSFTNHFDYITELGISSNIYWGVIFSIGLGISFSSYMVFSELFKSGKLPSLHFDINKLKTLNTKRKDKSRTLEDLQACHQAIERLSLCLALKAASKESTTLDDFILIKKIEDAFFKLETTVKHQNEFINDQEVRIEKLNNKIREMNELREQINVPIKMVSSKEMTLSKDMELGKMKAKRFKRNPDATEISVITDAVSTQAEKFQDHLEREIQDLKCLNQSLHELIQNKDKDFTRMKSSCELKISELHELDDLVKRRDDQIYKTEKTTNEFVEQMRKILNPLDPGNSPYSFNGILEFMHRLVTQTIEFRESQIKKEQNIKNKKSFPVNEPIHCSDGELCCNCSSNVDCEFYQYMNEQINGIPRE